MFPLICLEVCVGLSNLIEYLVFCVVMLNLQVVGCFALCSLKELGVLMLVMRVS